MKVFPLLAMGEKGKEMTLRRIKELSRIGNEVLVLASMLCALFFHGK